MANNSEDEKDEKDGHGLSMSDAIRKIVTTGVSAAFMTEEAIRSRVSELKLPKETLNLLLQGASKSKDQLMNRVTDEVVTIINKIDFVKEASRFVEEHKFKISAEVEVIKKDGKFETKVSKPSED
ncbi:MAG: hypothetical protein EOP05_18905 [Proteobacteria bacterium]|nr:MAG: hypothetical protein EOP05_18905 [Pseudomonadota bacterium]